VALAPATRDAIVEAVLVKARLKATRQRWCHVVLEKYF
jgi:hypothetical protein